MIFTPLPIDDAMPQIIAALRGGNCAVLRAPTGAGKTTRVPPALLDAGLAGKGQVLLLQPRRLAARAAAWRIAEERGSPLGQEIGYQVRFERKATRQTRLLVLTEGLFVRMLQDDPLLEQVGAVVFDEFHERTLNADLSLAISRRLQMEVRPDLKLLVMSATLDPRRSRGFSAIVRKSNRAAGCIRSRSAICGTMIDRRFTCRWRTACGR